MEKIKEEIGADGRKKIYVRYTERELAEMKDKSGRKPPERKRKGGTRAKSFFGRKS